MPRMEVEWCRSLAAQAHPAGTRQPRPGLQLSTEFSGRAFPMKGRARTGYWAPTSSKEKKTTQGRLGAALQSRRQPGGQCMRNQSSRPAARSPLWLESLWINYGPFGRLQNAAMVCWSRCGKPERSIPAPPPGGRGKACSVLPVRARHLLRGARRSQPSLRRYGRPEVAPGPGTSSPSVKRPGGEWQGHVTTIPPWSSPPPAWPRLLCRAFHIPQQPGYSPATGRP